MVEPRIVIAHGRETSFVAQTLMRDLLAISVVAEVDTLSSPSKILLTTAAAEPSVVGLALIEDKLWMSMFTALRWLRGQYALKSIPIIVITSFLDPKNDSDLLEEGATGVAMVPLADTGYRRLAKSLLRSTGTKGGSGVRSGLRTAIHRRK